jgi:hypothetical protein
MRRKSMERLASGVAQNKMWKNVFEGFLMIEQMVL